MAFILQFSKYKIILLFHCQFSAETVREFFIKRSKETLHCVNVIGQISSIFFYLFRSALPDIPDDNDISRSRDRRGRYGRSISADNSHQKFRLDKLTRKNNKPNVYSVITTVVPYCKSRGILLRNSTEQKGQIRREKDEYSVTQCRLIKYFALYMVFVLYRVIVCLYGQTHWKTYRVHTCFLSSPRDIYTLLSCDHTQNFLSKCSWTYSFGRMYLLGSLTRKKIRLVQSLDTALHNAMAEKAYELNSVCAMNETD